MENLEVGKRNSVNWFKIMNQLGNEKVLSDFFVRFSTLHKSKPISKNRCAYYALCKYYSTTAIFPLLEKIKVDLL